jgi:aminodeoxyfutalosine synthase
MEINLAIAGRARAGMDLTAAEIDELATADVLSLGMLADEVRRAKVGDRVTFVRVHDWKPGDTGVPEAATEVRLSAIPETLDETISAIQVARAAAGARRLSGFALDQLVGRAHSGWGTLPEILKQLKDSGLDALAEVPVDQMHEASPALQMVADAGLDVGCVSIQRPVAGDRTGLLIRMRTLAAEFPQIRRASPLPREQSTMVPTTGYDDVRIVALARLAIPNVPHIQVDWSQYGPKLAQVALTFGADELDRVSPLDDESLGRRRMAAEDVKRNIAAAGFVAVERDPRA